MSIKYIQIRIKNVNMKIILKCHVKLVSHDLVELLKITIISIIFSKLPECVKRKVGNKIHLHKWEYVILYTQFT